jgi:hypothetical protein
MRIGFVVTPPVGVSLKIPLIPIREAAESLGGSWRSAGAAGERIGEYLATSQGLLPNSLLCFASNREPDLRGG